MLVKVLCPLINGEYIHVANVSYCNSAFLGIDKQLGNDCFIVQTVFSFIRNT